MNTMHSQEILDGAKKIGTASVANIIAGYPYNPLCLKLFPKGDTTFYTDHSVKCSFPEVGPVVGHAVTCVSGPVDPNKKAYTLFDLLQAIEDAPKPVVVVIQQDFDEEKKRHNAQVGGVMMNAFKALGAVGLITNGPARDLGEIRELGMQYMLTGTTPDNAGFAFYEINTPVSVFGMQVAPGDMVHMDEDGAVKFPADQLEAIVTNANKLAEAEDAQMAQLKKATTKKEIMAAFGIK